MTAEPKRILLVEDNRADAALLREMLDDGTGAFSVVWADRLQAALDRFTDETFSAALLDLSLPDSHGLPTFERLQEVARNIPIIIVTGREDEQLAISAIRQGAQDYLVKDGLTGRAITRAITYAMDRKRSEKALRRSEARFRLLSETAAKLLAAENPQTVVNDLCRGVMAHLDCQFFFNFMADEGRGSPLPGGLRLNACAGIPDDEARKIAWLEYGSAVCGCAARDGCRIVAEDVQHTPDPRTELIKGYGIRAYACHPLQVPGRVMGTLSFGTNTRDRFSDDELAVMKTVADQVAVAMQRLQAQQVIERAKNEWERTFDSVPDLIAILDERHRIVRVNRAMAERLGVTPGACVGLACYESLHGCGTPISGCPHVLTLADGQAHTAEVREARLNGDFLVTTSPLRDAAGRLTGAVHVARDITEQKRAEEAVRTLQQREKEDAIRIAWGQSAIDTINVMREGVALLEIDGTILSVNPAVERLTGLVGGAIVGRNLETLLPDFMTGADLNTARHGLVVLRRGHVPDLPPLRLTRPDRTSFLVLPSVSLMTAPEGGRRVAVLSLNDVTALHEMSRGLELSEQKYRELVQSANSIIMRITPDHAITFFNEFAQKFFGYEAKDVVGKNVLGTIVPEVDSEGRNLRELMNAITVAPELHANNENENMRKDGRRVWVHWSNRAVRDDQGNVVEILCVGADITNRREMEKDALRYQQRLRELTERLAGAEEEDRWRISRYIHDTIIQNLSLSSIRLGSIAKPLVDSDLTEEAEKVRQVRVLLDQATDECRMVMSDLTPALLYELGLIPALNDLAHQLEVKHGARMLVEHDGLEVSLQPALRGLVFQSVRELVMNALKHAGPCEIRVDVSHGTRDLVVRVADDGKGFDPVAAAARSHEHGGFGLFNIRQRLEGLGGRIEIESAVGKGTRATIVVPVVPAVNSEQGRM